MNNNHNQEPPPQNGPPPMVRPNGQAPRTMEESQTIDTKCETGGGPHSFTEYPAVSGYTQETAYATMGNYHSRGTGSLPSNTVLNPREDLKAITTRSGVTLAGPSVYPPPLFKEVEQEPKTITNQLSLPELTSTKMILDLTDRSTTRPASIAKDIFIKVGKFHFPTDFVVVDYVVDPRVPLILGRPFLRTKRALIDVYGEELTICVDDAAITFKVGQTSKYSYKDTESINRVDVIDVAWPGEQMPLF
nr:reverse transcriptase domain-containing protein [Tanacetum cinerariifolium]